MGIAKSLLKQGLACKSAGKFPGNLINIYVFGGYSVFYYIEVEI